MKQIIVLLLSCFAFNTIKANNDTTQVKIPFMHNEWRLTDEAKNILNDVSPNDTSIILKKINIYGYSGNDENETSKNLLSAKRATEIKNYLIKNGIDAKLMGIIEGKGKNKLPEKDATQESNAQQLAVIVIEYEAKLVEETIIIQSTKRKKED